MDLGRNLENIRRQKGDWAEGALVASSAERTVKETLLGWIPPGRYLNVVELGIGAEPGAGAFAEVSGAHYHGFDRRPSRLQAPPKPGGEVHRLPDGAELSLPTASQDLFLSLFTLERLRMDELYMSIAEMRRVVKPGGYAALASLHPGNTWWERLASNWAAKRGHGAPLQLAHYLSPEDWDTVRDETLSLGGGRTAGLALLRRHADDTPSPLA